MSRIINKLAKIALAGVLTFGLSSMSLAMTPQNKGHNFHTPKSAKARLAKRHRMVRPMIVKSVAIPKTADAKPKTYTASPNSR